MKRLTLIIIAIMLLSGCAQSTYNRIASNAEKFNAKCPVKTRDACSYFKSASFDGGILTYNIVMDVGCPNWIADARRGKKAIGRRLFKTKDMQIVHKYATIKFRYSDSNKNFLFEHVFPTIGDRNQIAKLEANRKKH